MCYKHNFSDNILLTQKSMQFTIWQPTLIFLPGESHGKKSLAGHSPQGHKELDMTEVT